MNFSQLETFLSVARMGSFTRAADALYVSPSALMQQVTSLEKNLGFRVFTRNSRGVSLTKAGRLYFDGAEAILAQHKQLIARCWEAAMDAPTLRVGIPQNINPPFLLSLCAAFEELYPGSRVLLHTVAGGEAVNNLKNKSVDICTLTNFDIADEKSVRYEPLFTVPQYCVVAKRNALGQKENITLEDIKDIKKEIGVWDSLQPYAKLQEAMQGRTLKNLHADTRLRRQ